MNKIKILFVENHLSTGGAPQFALKRIESLLPYEIRNEIEIFVVEYANLSDEYTVQRNKIRNIIKPENFYTLYENKHELIDIIKDNEIDIIHLDEISEAFDPSIPDDIMEELYSSNRTWKIVETCHNVWFDPENSKIYNPDAYALCSPWHLEKTFKNTPSYKELILYPFESKIPTHDKKLNSKIKLGFDLSKKHIINVGLWTPGKNQKEGVEIARIMASSNPEILFHFIGNQAPNFEEYWSPIMENIPPNVIVWGERPDIDEFMNAADLFMFNSTWECNPLVLRESISHGLRTISRNLPQYMDMFSKHIINMNDDITSTKYKIISLLSTDMKTSLEDEFSSFGEKYFNLYKRVFTSDKIGIVKNQQKVNINKSFIGNPFLEITGNSKSEFIVNYYDEDNSIHYTNNIRCNNWIRLNRRYYTKWRTKVFENGVLIEDSTLDLSYKKVYISIDSSSIGDTLAWIPYIKEFKDKHRCNMVASTFMNHLFTETYPDIEFVEPATEVFNIHAMYNIGWFYKDNGEFDNDRNPLDFKKQPLQKTASDILGLEYTEIKPKLVFKNNTNNNKIGIAIHSTCQAKYWNNPNGWQDVVDYLKSNGYEVILYSSEDDGYMGNKQPLGVTKFERSSITNLISDLSECRMFIGLGSGLTWLAWSINIPVVLISGFSEEYSEMSTDFRVINKDVCNGCFNRHRLDPSDWNWCPDFKDTDRMFECTKSITSDMVIDKINDALEVKNNILQNTWTM